MVENASLADLQKILRKTQTKVASLQKRREKLLADVDSIDQEISQLTGSETGSVRFKNDKSLLAVIIDVLGKSKKGMTLGEIASAVEKTGYRSSSKNFSNVVYQNIYKTNQIVRNEETGKYTIG